MTVAIVAFPVWVPFSPLNRMDVRLDYIACLFAAQRLYCFDEDYF